MTTKSALFDYVKSHIDIYRNRDLFAEAEWIIEERPLNLGGALAFIVNVHIPIYIKRHIVFPVTDIAQP